MIKILEIGAGKKETKEKKLNEETIYLDKFNLHNIDVVHDLEKTPLPFQDDEFDIIISEHVLEHINHFISLMHELHRITKNQGLIKIKVPFYSAWGQYNDPTHCRSFTPFTFDYFKAGKYSHEVGNIRFNVMKRKLNFGVGKSKVMNWLFNPIINMNLKFYCRFFAWIFPAAEIEFELEVVKNE